MGGAGCEDGDDDDDGGAGCEDDIYIMMQCLCVCHEKSSLPTSELSAARLAGRRLALA